MSTITLVTFVTVFILQKLSVINDKVISSYVLCKRALKDLYVVCVYVLIYTWKLTMRMAEWLWLQVNLHVHIF